MSLFRRVADDAPIIFDCRGISDDQREKMTELVEGYGGRVGDSTDPVIFMPRFKYKPGTYINLQVFDIQYIVTCIARRKLLSLGRFRLSPEKPGGRCQRSVFLTGDCIFRRTLRDAKLAETCDYDSPLFSEEDETFEATETAKTARSRVNESQSAGPNDCGRTSRVNCGAGDGDDSDSIIVVDTPQEKPVDRRHVDVSQKDFSQIRIANFSQKEILPDESSEKVSHSSEATFRTALSGFDNKELSSPTDTMVWETQGCFRDDVEIDVVDETVFFDDPLADSKHNAVWLVENYEENEKTRSPASSPSRSPSLGMKTTSKQSSKRRKSREGTDERISPHGRRGNSKVRLNFELENPDGDDAEISRFSESDVFETSENEDSLLSSKLQSTECDERIVEAAANGSNEKSASSDELPGDRRENEKSTSPVPSPSESPQVPQSSRVPESPQVTESSRVPQLPQDPQSPQVPESPQAPESPHFPQSPQVSESPHFPQSPQVSESPHFPQSPQAPESPHFPQSPQVSESPHFPQSPQVSESPHFPQSPQVSESPHFPQSPQVSESPQVSQSPYFPQSPQVSQSPQLRQTRSSKRSSTSKSVSECSKNQPKIYKWIVPHASENNSENQHHSVFTDVQEDEVDVKPFLMPESILMSGETVTSPLSKVTSIEPDKRIDEAAASRLTPELPVKYEEKRKNGTRTSEPPWIESSAFVGTATSKKRARRSVASPETERTKIVKDHRHRPHTNGKRAKPEPSYNRGFEEASSEDDDEGPRGKVEADLSDASSIDHMSHEDDQDYKPDLLPRKKKPRTSIEKREHASRFHRQWRTALNKCIPRDENVIRRLKFTEAERREMVAYLCSFDNIESVQPKGLRIWSDMLKSGILTHRTVKSLENHFTKTLLPNIENYFGGMSTAHQEQFLRIRNSKRA